MKALMYFKSTMIQTDIEKILCVQKIPSERFLEDGRFQQVPCLKFQNFGRTPTDTNHFYVCTKTITSIVPILKITKSTFHKKIVPIVPK